MKIIEEAPFILQLSCPLCKSVLGIQKEDIKDDQDYEKRTPVGLSLFYYVVCAKCTHHINISESFVPTGVQKKAHAKWTSSSFD